MRERVGDSYSVGAHFAHSSPYAPESHELRVCLVDELVFLLGGCLALDDGVSVRCDLWVFHFCVFSVDFSG